MNNNSQQVFEFDATYRGKLLISENAIKKITLLALKDFNDIFFLDYIKVYISKTTNISLVIGGKWKDRSDELVSMVNNMQRKVIEEFKYMINTKIWNLSIIIK